MAPDQRDSGPEILFDKPMLSEEAATILQRIRETSRVYRDPSTDVGAITTVMIPQICREVSLSEEQLRKALRELVEQDYWHQRGEEYDLTPVGRRS